MNKLVQECSYFMFGDENEYVGEDQMFIPFCRTENIAVQTEEHIFKIAKKKNLTIVTTYKFDNSYYYNYLNWEFKFVAHIAIYH